ncbi:MAG: hypothetical protein QMC36_05210 [Patescibacteria group bacterium]
MPHVKIVSAVPFGSVGETVELEDHVIDSYGPGYFEPTEDPAEAARIEAEAKAAEEAAKLEAEDAEKKAAEEAAKKEAEDKALKEAKNASMKPNATK